MFGHVLDSAIIERGLLELNPDFHFDLASKRNGWHPYQAIRQGVFYKGEHICSMDRGHVPEYKQWQLETRTVEVGWEEADKEDVDTTWRTIHPHDPDYVQALANIEAKVLGYGIRPDGRLVKVTLVARRKVKTRVVLVGWRHTFESILRRNITGVTRSSLGMKFGVDMLALPMGSPQEVFAGLLEE